MRRWTRLFVQASANLHRVDVLPTGGANVYDILNHDVLAITTAGIAALEARLSTAEPVGGHVVASAPVNGHAQRVEPVSDELVPMTGGADPVVHSEPPVAGEESAE